MPHREHPADRLVRLARETHDRVEARDLARDAGGSNDAHHHPAEAATDADARERQLRNVLRLKAEEERLLRLADAATRGEYGTCLDCGGAIPEARLLVIPDAERCVRCQATASGRSR